MRKEDFAEVLSDINEKHIVDARADGKAPKPVWLKWGAMAACLCLVTGLAIHVLNLKGGPGRDDPLHPLNVIEYNGAYYESVDMADAKILNAYNLPHEITADMIGVPLGTGLDHNGAQTRQVFYQYEPYADIVTVTAEPEQKRAQRAVYIVEDGGAYTFALFCNFISFDSNTHTEASEMFVIYGVDEAEDIAKVTIGADNITDTNQIKALFENLCHSHSMGNDDYQNAIFKGMSEEEQRALSVELADSAIEISIATAEGVAINHITYYPTINYVSWALNYYKLDNSIV